MYDFNIILEKIGGLGRYQMLLVVMVCYSSIPDGYTTFASVFIKYTPAYRCKIQSASNTTSNELNYDLNINLTKVHDYESDLIDACYRPGYNTTSCSEDVINCVNQSAVSGKCDTGYQYDTSIFTQTVITEFDLVCDRSYLDTLGLTLFMIGLLIGSLTFGNVSDRFGRKSTMFVSFVFFTLSLFGTAFIHNVALFILFRVMTAFFSYGSYLTSFVYLLEITSTEWRTVLGMCFQICFAFGYMLLSGIAYQWRDWHDMQLALALLNLPFIIILIFIPESPRWLFANNHNKRGIQITRKFAKYNKVKLNEPEIWEEASVMIDLSTRRDGIEKEKRKYSSIDLFRTKRTRIITLKITFAWFASSVAYFGVYLNTAALSGDIFINHLLGGVMEIAAYLLVMFMMNRVGRRRMIIFMFVLAGVGFLCYTLITQYARNDNSLLMLSQFFALLSKMGISGAYAIMYNYTIELFPTVIRACAVSAGGTAAEIGGIIVPSMIALQKVVFWLPNVIYGVVAIFAAALCYTLPETNNHKMMETIEEAELFYVGQERFANRNHSVNVSNI